MLNNYFCIILGILYTPYQTKGWNGRKAFLLKCLCGPGFGSIKTTEAKILEQADLLSEHIESLISDGTLVNLRKILPRVTVNVLFQILLNKSSDYDDHEQDDTQKMVNNLPIHLMICLI